MRRTLRILAIILVGFFLFVSLWPNEPIDWTVRFDASQLGDDLDAYLADAEAQVPGIIEGAQKQIVWNGAPGTKTELSVVFLHGFSASSMEINPVHRQVAQALGANLYLPRFTGHARDGDALANATAGDWYNDLIEALEIGRRLGEKTVVLSSSTGGTLAALAALDISLAKDLKGIVFISPNFGLNAPGSFLLDWPFARWTVPMIIGDHRDWTPDSPDHAKWWTNSYPTRAVFPMAKLVRDVKTADFSSVFVPAFFIYSDQDEVVDPDATRGIAQDWGGKTEVWIVKPGPGIDPGNHVLAGDIKSPALTETIVKGISAWVSGL